jgi:hypothetical protein
MAAPDGVRWLTEQTDCIDRGTLELLRIAPILLSDGQDDDGELEPSCLDRERVAADVRRDAVPGVIEGWMMTFSVSARRMRSQRDGGLSSAHYLPRRLLAATLVARNSTIGLDVFDG